MLVNFLSKSMPSSNQSIGKYIDCKFFINGMSSTGTISKLACPRPIAEMGAPAYYKNLYLSTLKLFFNRTLKIRYMSWLPPDKNPTKIGAYPCPG